jgi:hypothetical protein
VPAWTNCSLENTIGDALWFLLGVVVSLVCISAPRMRHNSDEAEQPPNPSGWCSLVMNMSAASQRQNHDLWRVRNITYNSPILALVYSLTAQSM